MADIQRRLALLLGRETVRPIRKTYEAPPRISVIDVVSAVLGLNGNAAAVMLGRLTDDHPEVTTGCCDFKFPEKGQRNTAVTDARGIALVLMLLPGRTAARARS